MQTFGINHVALYVDDLAASRDFYIEHFAGSVVREDESLCFLDMGDDTYVALFRRDPVMINHFCFTIEDYDPDVIETDMRAKGLTVRRTEDRVFVEDPDGHLVQISGDPEGEFTG